MQSPTGLIGGVVLLAALAVVLAIAAPLLLALPVFLVAFIAFLVWRGKRRASPALQGRDRVPRTEEAAADPAGDSGVRDAARSASHSA